MESQWKFGGLTPWDLSVRTAKQISEDDVFGRSAQLAYYFLLALFPLLLFLLSSLGYFAAAGEELRRKLFEYLSRMMPGSASQLVNQTVTQVIASRGSGKVVLGLLGALWAASNGVGAVIETLNIAYHVQETRPWWKKRSIAVGLTIALSLLMVVALTLALFGGKLAEVIGSHLAIGPAVSMAWKIVQWPVALGFMFLAFALVYYFAPNVKDPEWHWISPGAVAGVIVWVVISLGFRLYLQFFNSYNATYGSLGAVIILMLWLYLTGTSILVGGEINSQIAQADEHRRAHESQLQKLREELERDFKKAA